MDPQQGDITVLLHRWRAGDREAGDAVMQQMYAELHRIAEIQMSRERADHTLRPTALVNELYLRMIRGVNIDWHDRAHFCAVAAQNIRRILVEHARKLQAARRSGIKVPLDQIFDLGAVPDQDILRVDEALEELAKADERASRGIELRYFGGLTEEEIAAALEVSVSTVKRDFTFGRAWMLKYLSASA